MVAGYTRASPPVAEMRGMSQRSFWAVAVLTVRDCCPPPWKGAARTLVVGNLCNDGLIGTGPFVGDAGLRETIPEQSGIPPVISRMLVYSANLD